MAQIFTYFWAEHVPMDILYITVPCWKAVEAQIFLCSQNMYRSLTGHVNYLNKHKTSKFRLVSTTGQWLHNAGSFLLITYLKASVKSTSVTDRKPFKVISLNTGTMMARTLSKIMLQIHGTQCYMWLCGRVSGRLEFVFFSFFLTEIQKLIHKLVNRKFKNTK